MQKGSIRIAALPLFLILCLVALAPLRAALEDDGPFAVGYTDVITVDTHYGRGQIPARIYYPATAEGELTPPATSSGPFPLVGFMHGYLGSVDDYDTLCHQIASWGFVVASDDTQTFLRAKMQYEALDTRSLLQWVSDEGSDPASVLFGMTDNGPWAAVGHSMGGGALNYLIGYEPRVRLIIGLQPYRGPLLGDSTAGSKNLKAFTGRTYYFAGSVDTVVPAANVHQYFAEAVNAERRVYYEGIGLGHLGPTDAGSTADPLSAAEEMALHFRIVTGTLRAEAKGEENLYYDLLGSGAAAQPIEFQSGCSLNPILWAVESDGALNLGLAAVFGKGAELAESGSPAAVTTGRGTAGLEPGTEAILFRSKLPDTGTVELSLPLPTTTTYFQGCGPQTGGRLSRAVNSDDVTTDPQ